MLDWLDDEQQKKKERLKEKSEEEVLPSEWEEIEKMELELREENRSLANVERRAETKPAPKGDIRADHLEVPRLCDQCYLIDKCPYYKQGASCYFRNQVRVEDPQSLLELTKLLLELQGERVLFGSFIEKSEGGYVDANLSKEIKLMMELMKDFKELTMKPQDEISIKIKGSPAASAGEATANNPGSGGILSQIFGGGNTNMDTKGGGGET